MNANLDLRQAPVSAAGRNIGQPVIGPGSASQWLLLLLRIIAGALGIGFALATALVLLLSVAGQQAQAATVAPETETETSTGARARARAGAGADNREPATAIDRLRNHEASGLMIQTPGGLRVAPMLSSRARLRVTGNIVRATVAQRFHNPFPAGDGQWLEGTYLFPLPDDAAVDHLRMRVGDRVVEAEIHEKMAARAIHAAARAAGQTVSMVEQQRPNAFRTHVANIAPDAAIEVEIEYQQSLALKDGRWTLRLPTVLTPRYARPSEEVGRQADAGMHQPVALGFADLNPVSIRVELDPGLQVTRPRSETHELRIEPGEAGDVIERDASAWPRWSIETIDAVRADRDFVLEWSPAPAATPSASMRIERHGDELYGLLIVSPPVGSLENQPRLARETTFVIDTSGSMGGESIAQARRALLFALDRLSTDDRFNIIEFNSRHRSLYPSPRAADAHALSQARAWVNRLEATGGTEMRGALEQALSSPLPEGLLGQVVFITDGAIDHEDELISLVQQRVGARRLFTVGIGSAPNSWFMRKTAAIGGGTHLLIGRTGEVENRMAALFDRIARPVSSHLSMSMSGARAIDSPALPRELFAGEPLIQSLRLDAVPDTVVVTGRHSETWRIPVTVQEAPDAGLHVLWARNRLEALGDAIRRVGERSEAGTPLRAEALKLALNHHLVSQWTSLVAVDSRISRPQGATLDGGDIPSNMPAGWSLPQTATPAGLQLALGVLLLGLGFVLMLNRRISQWIACFGSRRALR